MMLFIVNIFLGLGVIWCTKEVLGYFRKSTNLRKCGFFLPAKVIGYSYEHTGGRPIVEFEFEKNTIQMNTISPLFGSLPFKKGKQVSVYYDPLLDIVLIQSDHSGRLTIFLLTGLYVLVFYLILESVQLLS